MLQHETLSSEAGDDVTPEMIVQGLSSRDPATQMRAVRVARCILCEEDPPITAMVQAGIIAPLLDALDRNDRPNFQNRALGVLTNVAFGSREHTLDVAYSGAIPKLINLLVSKGDLLERTILTLGNFALHGAEARNAVLTHGAVPAMLPYMCTNTPIMRLRTFVLAYSNLCSNNEDEINLELVSPALPYIYELLDMKDEEPLIIEDTRRGVTDSASQQKPIHKTRTASDIVDAACTALANIMLGPDECIEAVQAVPGLTARLVALLGHEAGCVQGAALSAVGNMLAGTDQQVDRCLDANCLDHIVSLLQCSNTSLVQEAARATGNILAGTHSQIQRVLEKGILTLLKNILGGEDPECQKHALHAVTSLCMTGLPEQRTRVVSRGVLEPYCALLAASDRAVAGEALDSLDVLLQAAERDGNVKLLCYMLDELEVLDKIQQLQNHMDHCCKLVNMSVTLRKHAREERSVVCDEIEFTSEKIMQELNSQHQATQTRATRAVYCMLQEQNPPINALLEAGILAPLLQWLDRDARSDLLHLAAWALSIITGTRKHTKDVADNGAIHKLMALLVHGDKVSELAASSLGSIALHGNETRDAVLAYTRSETGLTELRTFVRAYLNLCSNIGPEQTMKLEFVFRVMPFVSELFYIDDRVILKETCRAFVCNTRHGTDHHHSIEAMQGVPGLLARVVALMGHQDADVKKAAFFTVINMLNGTSAQIDRCLDAGCLDHVISLLQCRELSLVEVAAMVATNIFGGSHSQIQRALEKHILTPLMIVLTKEDTRYQKLAVIAITNLYCNGSAEQRARVMSCGVLQPYCALLAASDRAVARFVLNGLTSLLRAAETDDKLKPLCMKFDEIGVLEHLQKLIEQEIDEDLRRNAIVASVTIRQLARDEHIVIAYEKVYTPAQIVQELKSLDLVTLARATIAAGLMLDKQGPSITAMLQAGAIPPLLAALDKDDCFELQLIATSAFLVIVVHGEHKHRVAAVNAGAISKLVRLLSRGYQLALRAALLLGTITRGAPMTRDSVLSHGAVQAMLPHMRPDTPLELLRACMQAYRNWCSYPVASMSKLKLLLPALPYVSELLKHEDKDVLNLACGAFANIMNGPHEYKEEVQALPRVTERLVALLGHEATKVKITALVAVGNMLCGNAAQAARCIEAGCVSHILLLLKDNEPTLVEAAVLATSNMLLHTNSETQRVLEDILAALMDILAYAEPNSYLQYKTINALDIMAESEPRENKMALIQAGAIPKLIAILSHGVAVAERAARVLGCIVRNVPEIREYMFTHNVVPAMVQLMRPDAPLELLKTLITSYLCLWYKCSEPSEVLKHVSPHLLQISGLLSTCDKIVLENALWALNYLTKINEGIEAVQAVPGLTARLVALLGHEAAGVKVPAINAVMCMLSGTDTQADRCFDVGCIEPMISYLECRDPLLIEKAREAAHDSLGATHPHLQRALDKDVLTPLMSLLACSPKGQKRTLKGITNLCRRATTEQRARVVSRGVLEPYCALLAASDRAVAGEALDSLDVLLQVAVNDDNLFPFCLKLVEMGVLDQMKQLREHEDADVKEKACRLLNTYFPEESEKN